MLCYMLHEVHNEVQKILSLSYLEESILFKFVGGELEVYYYVFIIYYYIYIIIIIIYSIFPSMAIHKCLAAHD